MKKDKHNLSPEEIARLGDEIYERTIRKEVEKEHYGDVVAIDVISGEYAIGETGLAASRELRARLPNAVVWCVRVGHDALYRIGRLFYRKPQ